MANVNFRETFHYGHSSCSGAETEEAAPAAQPVAAPVAAPVTAHAPPQPAADSLLGDLLMDIGPTQPAPPPVQPAGMPQQLRT